MSLASMASSKIYLNLTRRLHTSPWYQKDSCSQPGKASRQMKPTGGGDSKSRVFPCQTDKSTLYEARKFRHELSTKVDVMIPFQPFPEIPNGVFRETKDEKLGPKCTGKENHYKNQEYFCFHHMTFFDLHMQLSKCRLPQPDFKRKCITY